MILNNVLHKNNNLQVPEALQSAYFSPDPNLSFSIQSGYLYHKDGGFGFASVSHDTNHMAEAVHAALAPVLNWCVENRITCIVFVSDSTVSQYRNIKNTYLVREFAKKHKMKITWLFTESGHGMSVTN